MTKFISVILGRDRAAIRQIADKARVIAAEHEAAVARLHRAITVREEERRIAIDRRDRERAERRLAEHKMRPFRFQPF